MNDSKIQHGNQRIERIKKLNQRINEFKLDDKLECEFEQKPEESQVAAGAFIKQECSCFDCLRFKKNMK